MMYRQGDILLVRAAGLPLYVVKQDDGVVARGEATGHMHQILSEAIVWMDIDGSKYVEVYGHEAQLRHEEHGSIIIPGPAIYRVIQQREYRPQGVFYVED